MRAEASGTSLTDEQSRIASAGIKALIPIVGDKTMLDLSIGNLQSAGFTSIGLVIGDEHDEIRDFCAQRGYDASFAIQKEPLGTADAVLSAESLVDPHELFLILNSDNLYPVDSLRRLREMNRPAMIGFERRALIENSNIPEERIAKFATIEIGSDGNLARIVEKPDFVDPDALVSMNAWLFDETIFNACRNVGLSPRGEYELTSAVQFGIDKLNSPIAVVRSSEGVLDLSSRADIGTVSGRAGTESGSDRVAK